MEIKIYAPVDCDVLPITDCDDDVFAKKWWVMALSWFQKVMSSNHS
ncbi:hypothetical protein [Spiroplasma clarkii]|nr:hypothetical protein [Spiroplasma clarkii]